ncbi:unnamed protein product, partial [marine sediment metagenome]
YDGEDHVYSCGAGEDRPPDDKEGGRYRAHKIPCNNDECFLLFNAIPGNRPDSNKMYQYINHYYDQHTGKESLFIYLRTLFYFSAYIYHKEASSTEGK